MANYGTELAQRLERLRDYDLVDVDIFLRGEPAAAVPTLDHMESLSAIDQRRTAVNRLKEDAAVAQSSVVDFLNSFTGSSAFIDEIGQERTSPRITGQRWINNSVAAQVNREALSTMLRRDDIEHVEIAHHADIEDLMDNDVDWSTSERRLIKDASGATDAVARAWSIDHINAPLLWNLGLTGEGVTCAVIDTGVNYNHPDLEDRMWEGGPNYPKHGYDFADRDQDPMDRQGHGTACAGIVAGTGRKGLQTGVAPGARVMALRVGGEERNYWDALEFAIDRGADVVSMSMSWKYPSSPDYPGWRRACESVLLAGLLHANSIGNQGDDLRRHPLPYNIATPGNCPPPRLHPKQSPSGGTSSPISCGAIDSADRLASYSGRGPAAWEIGPYHDYPYDSGQKPGLIKPDLCAPGPGTRSCNWTYKEGGTERPYLDFGGTSAATPHLGGALCLLAQASRQQNASAQLRPANVQEALEESAVQVSGQTQKKENHYGAGRIDVYAAYRYGRDKGFWS